MKMLSYKKINNFGLCYDPIKYMPKNWRGSIIRLLKMQNVPAKDRIWVVVRNELLTRKQLRFFGLACARQCEHLSNDMRVKQCNDVVQAFLKGKATREQLYAALSAASAVREEQCRMLIKIIQKKGKK